MVVNDDVHADDDDDVDGNTENLYQVPPPAKSVEDLPRKYIKTVCITVNPEIFARTLFSRIALKDIFAALQIRH